MVALVSILEIDSSNVALNRQTFLWSPALHQHQTAIAMLPEENSYVPKYKKSANKFIRKINPTSDRRYHRKKNYLRWDPISNKKSRFFKKSKFLKNSKKKYPLENSNYQTPDIRISDNVNLPSSYLTPPKITDNTRHYYEKSKKLSKNRPQDSAHNGTAGNPKNHRYQDENPTTDDDVYADDRPIYIRDHAPEQQVEATDDKETNESGDQSTEKSNDSSQGSKDRIEFHIHGHAGPETYMFGFDTGDG